MTTLLASNLKKLGYTVLIYSHIFTPDGVFTECKVSKSIGKEGFAGLGQGSTIIESSEMASKSVDDQINLPEEKSCILIFEMKKDNSDNIIALCNEYGGMIDYKLEYKVMYVTMKDATKAELLVNCRNSDFTIRYKSYLDEPLLPPRKDDIEEYMKDREEENQEFEEYLKEELETQELEDYMKESVQDYS
jgi:hypothetical protein